MAYYLRTTDKDGKSHGGFQWPMQIGATVTAPDWEPTAECGNGLHGWLYGQGDHGCSDYPGTDGAKWYALEVVEADIIMLGAGYVFAPQPDVAALPTASRPEAAPAASAATPRPIHNPGPRWAATVGEAAAGAATAGADAAPVAAASPCAAARSAAYCGWRSASAPSRASARTRR